MGIRWFDKKASEVAVKPAPMDWVVDAYSNVLAKDEGMIVDASALPVSKTVLKQALLVKHSCVNDEGARNALVNAYLMLSGYQQLSLAEKEVVKSYNQLMKTAPPELANKTPPKEITPEYRAFAVAITAIQPAYSALQIRVAAEHDELVKELHKAGLH